MPLNARPLGKARVEQASGEIAYGFAKYLRDALPNASFIGFTGTPIEKDDVNTPAVFGEYIDIYDITRYLMGDVTSVYAAGVNKYDRNQLGYPVDNVASTLEFASGAVGNIYTSATALSFKPWERVEVYGNKRWLAVEDQFELILYDEEEGPAKHWKPVIPNTLIFDEEFGGFMGLIENFCQVIRGAEEPLVTGWDGYRAYELNVASHLSMHRREIVPLPLEPAVADEEGFARQIAPSHAVAIGERVIGRQRGQEGFVPDAARVAIGNLGRTSDKGDVELIGAKLEDDVARRALTDLDGNAGMFLTVACKKAVEKAARCQRIDTDADAAEFALRERARRIYGMFELVDADGYVFDEMASGLCEPNAARMTLEKEDAKVFLQRPDSLADAGRADTKDVRGVTEVQIFGDRQRLDQRNHRDSRAKP